MSARIAGHPIHPMLVVFPLGLLSLSFVLHVINAAGAPQVWATAGDFAMGGGVIGGWLAAVFGLIDLGSIPPGRTRRVAFAHGAIAMLTLAAFTLAFFLRRPGGFHAGAPLILEILFLPLLYFAGFLGSSLVYVHGVGIAEAAPRDPACGAAGDTTDAPVLGDGA